MSVNLLSELPPFCVVSIEIQRETTGNYIVGLAAPKSHFFFPVKRRIWHGVAPKGLVGRMWPYKTYICHLNSCEQNKQTVFGSMIICFGQRL